MGKNLNKKTPVRVLETKKDIVYLMYLLAIKSKKTLFLLGFLVVKINNIKRLNCF